jgi:hypothetical protein
MARFAPVLPAKLYPYVDMSGPNSLHFVHAPQVMTCEELREWLEIACIDDRIILDCFAYELTGQVPDVDMLLEAAACLQHTDLTIVCPDVVANPEATLELLKENALRLMEYGSLMIVPHGTNLIAWVDCAKRMLDLIQELHLVEMPMFGIPRYLTMIAEQARWIAAAWLAGYAPGFYAHLLGCGSHLGEVLSVVGDHPHVISCDSTLPFAYAMEDMLYPPWPYRNKIEMRTEWWDATPDTLGQHRMGLLELNIAIWKAQVEHA